jgi:hypothetical protein
MGLNKYHAAYLIRTPLIEIMREKSLKYSGTTFQPIELINVINKGIIDGIITEQELKSQIFTWMFQGRKKILFRYICSEYLEPFVKYTDLKNYVDSNFSLSREIVGIENLRVSDQEEHLIDIKYTLNGEDPEKVDKIIFTYIKMVNHKTKNGIASIVKKIPIPVFVTIDFHDNQITSRVCSKSDIYSLNDIKVDDLEIGKAFLEQVILKFGISRAIPRIDISSVEKMIFKIHDDVTKLPEEIINQGNECEEEINQFIKKVFDKLGISSLVYAKEEMSSSLKDLILKQIIKGYEDKAIFEKDKYAVSIGLKASGSSLSKLNYQAPSREPVQSAPEYQNIRAVLSETERIKKNIILWVSVRKKDTKIRSKLYIESEGYGVISFEEYAFEEDIQNVFSKIRSAKSIQGIY